MFGMKVLEQQLGTARWVEIDGTDNKGNWGNVPPEYHLFAMLNGCEGSRYAVGTAIFGRKRTAKNTSGSNIETDHGGVQAQKYAWFSVVFMIMPVGARGVFHRQLQDGEQKCSIISRARYWMKTCGVE